MTEPYRNEVHAFNEAPRRTTGFLHRIAHALHVQRGEVVVWWSEDRTKLVVAFRCAGCGELSGKHERPTRRMEGS